jgi:hypothetical protein
MAKLISARARRRRRSLRFRRWGSSGRSFLSRRLLCLIRVIGELDFLSRFDGFFFFELVTDCEIDRGVRRISGRMWEKAVADGDVEQMFGMNIKQEGIEVQGDQVSILT